MEDVVATKSVKVLVDEYKAADAAVEAAKLAVVAAEQARSVACQAIALNVAPNKNVTFDGKPHTIVIRTNKHTGVDLYFFRGSKSDTIVVE